MVVKGYPNGILTRLLHLKDFNFAPHKMEIKTFLKAKQTQERTATTMMYKGRKEKKGTAKTWSDS